MKKISSHKLLWTLALLAIMLCAAAGAAFGADVTKIIDVASFVENGRIYDTVRPIAETFGIYVDWDQEGQKVTMTRGAFQVVMEVGSTELTIVTLGGSETLPLEAAPILWNGRVFLPTRFWAGAFGLDVVWHKDDGNVTVSEGEKTLAFAPGSYELKLTGGHFLKLYDQDEKLSFYYPENGYVAIVWDGYVEVLLTVKNEEYVIVAMNAGAGRNDPTNYTMEEFDRLIYENADASNGRVSKLSSVYYGVPAYRIAGLAAGIPQAGVVFLRNGYLCGLTIEAKPKLSVGATKENMLDMLSDGDVDDALENGGPSEIDEETLRKELSVVNAILDEIMASLVAK